MRHYNATIKTIVRWGQERKVYGVDENGKCTELVSHRKEQVCPKSSVDSSQTCVEEVTQQEQVRETHVNTANKGCELGGRVSIELRRCVGGLQNIKAYTPPSSFSVKKPGNHTSQRAPHSY